eukprot:4784_1
MTSGVYLNDTVITRSLWWHFITIIVPSNMNNTSHPSNAFLWVASANSGSNTNYNKYPSFDTDDIILGSYISCHIKMPVIVLFTNPNQPIKWYDDPTNKNRKNTALLCYSIYEEINFAQTPMHYATSRANVLALNAVQQYTQDKFNWNLEHFGVGGASKYGWIVWLHAAIDDRIISFVSVVYDLLNWIRNWHHQYQSYGGWTFALEDCWKLGIMADLDSVGQQNLNELIDPISFNDNYHNKHILVTTNGRDVFMLPDDSYYFWTNLSSPNKHYIFLPNTDHAGIEGLLETLPVVATWLKSTFIEPQNIPYLSWTLNFNDYSITAKTDIIPSKVTVWYAPSCRECNNRRDFRSMTLDIDHCASHIIIDHEYCVNTHTVYKDVDITNDYQFNQTDKLYYYQYTINKTNIDIQNYYYVFFLDFNYNNNSAVGWPIDYYDEFEFTTQIMIINNTFPFPDCIGTQCNSTLV